MPSGGQVPHDPEVRRIRSEIGSRARSGRDKLDPEGTALLRSALAEHRVKRVLAREIPGLTPEARRRLASELLRDELLSVLAPAAARAAEAAR
jgi:phage terminase small subunit